MLLRDFLYLDVERLRSLSAQAFSGVPETATSAHEHDLGGHAGGEAGFFSLVKTQAEVDYRYHRAATETRSLHHAVYTQLEGTLADEGLLTTVDDNFDFDTLWTESTFRDAAFVRVRGHVRVVDYAASMKSISGFRDLFRAFKLVQARNIEQARQAGAKTQQTADIEKRDLEKFERDIKALPLDSLSVMGKSMYQDGRARLKIRPLGAPTDHLFVGHCRNDQLLAGLGPSGALDTPADASWVSVGQVEVFPDKELTPMPTGNGLEDAIEVSSDAFRSISRMGTDAIFPAVGIVPIAIYREVSA